MRAFVYCRGSTQEQATDDHYSLANQEARCHDYIKQRSWKLVKVLRDVGSGKSDERDNYQELLRAIRMRRSGPCATTSASTPTPAPEDRDERWTLTIRA